MPVRCNRALPAVTPLADADAVRREVGAKIDAIAVAGGRLSDASAVLASRDAAVAALDRFVARVLPTPAEARAEPGHARALLDRLAREAVAMGTPTTLDTPEADHADAA